MVSKVPASELCPKLARSLSNETVSASFQDDTARQGCRRSRKVGWCRLMCMLETDLAVVDGSERKSHKARDNDGPLNILAACWVKFCP